MVQILLLPFASIIFGFLEVLSSIPSPSKNNVEIGPLTIHAYGLMIGLGMIAGVNIATRRWVKRGGTAEAIMQVVVWGVPAGIIGARAYHVVTDWPTYADTGWINALKITNGGLGIPGGLFLGVLFGYFAMRRMELDKRSFIDAALPGIPVAQAIGRLGNWFNQELFGQPTDLPWAVQIDSRARENANIPDEFLTAETFHPTFAYEAIWNLLLAGLLVFVTNRKLLKPGQSLFLWIAGYGVGRYFVESVRIDPASEILGIRVNHWVSAFAIIVGLVGLFLTRSSSDEDEAITLDADNGQDPDTEDNPNDNDDSTKDDQNADDGQDADGQDDDDQNADDDQNDDGQNADDDQNADDQNADDDQNVDDGGDLADNAQEESDRSGTSSDDETK